MGRAWREEAELRDGVEAAKHRRMLREQQVAALLTVRFYPRDVRDKAGACRRTLNITLRVKQFEMRCT